jgi:hypothetical protein
LASLGKERLRKGYLGRIAFQNMVSCMKMFPQKPSTLGWGKVLEETLINECSLPDLNRQPGKGVDFKSTVFTNFTKRAWKRMTPSFTGSKGYPLKALFEAVFHRGF